jgi:hypothetical protein
MMKTYPILAAAAILMLGMAGARASELPSYEFAGFPITPLQMSVLGQSGHVQEQPAAPTLMHDGLPASPHQIAVLSRHLHAAESAHPFESADTRTGTVTRSE